MEMTAEQTEGRDGITSEPDAVLSSFGSAQEEQLGDNKGSEKSDRESARWMLLSLSRGRYSITKANNVPKRLDKGKGVPA